MKIEEYTSILTSQKLKVEVVGEISGRVSWLKLATLL